MIIIIIEAIYEASGEAFVLLFWFIYD
jgi:hypothetical protein